MLIMNSLQQQEQIYDLFYKIARYHPCDVASTIASLFIQSLVEPNNSKLWPREGLVWVRYLQRQEIGNKDDPVDLETKFVFDTKWKEKYIKSILLSSCRWDEEVANKFVDDILAGSEASINLHNLMSWTMIVKWMQQNEVDEIEELLFELFQASQEQKELEKIRDIIIRGDSSNNKIDDLTKCLERYFLLSEAIEISNQIKKGVLAVDKYARVIESIQYLEKYYKDGWEYIKLAMEEYESKCTCKMDKEE